jgi:fructose-1,6-bisphosphatase-3
MDQLAHSFRNSAELQKHLRLLYQKGSLYLVRNGNLLFHAAIPMNPDGTFEDVEIDGQTYHGRALFDKIDQMIRDAYFPTGGDKHHQDALDYMLYLWCGPKSPLFNKDKMTTFERYFINDKELYKEKKGAFFELANTKEVCQTILREFGLDNNSAHIINGHVPVRTNKGESPIRAEGIRLVIDGGFSKPYHATTGISGYTLIYNSHGIQLVEHDAFESREQAILSGSDIHNRTLLQDFSGQRMRIRDTDKGKELLDQIASLEQLLHAYRDGTMREH